VSAYRCWRCNSGYDVTHPRACVAGNQRILDSMREYMAALKGCKKCGAGPWPGSDDVPLAPPADTEGEQR
jgi:hypothetical protein